MGSILRPPVSLSFCLLLHRPIANPHTRYPPGHPARHGQDAFIIRVERAGLSTLASLFVGPGFHFSCSSSDFHFSFYFDFSFYFGFDLDFGFDFGPSPSLHSSSPSSFHFGIYLHSPAQDNRVPRGPILPFTKARLHRSLLALAHTLSRQGNIPSHFSFGPSRSRSPLSPFAPLLSCQNDACVGVRLTYYLHPSSHHRRPPFATANLLASPPPLAEQVSRQEEFKSCF